MVIGLSKFLQMTITSWDPLEAENAWVPGRGRRVCKAGKGKRRLKTVDFLLVLRLNGGGEGGRRTGGGEFSVYKQWDVRGAVQLGFDGAIRYCQA